MKAAKAGTAGLGYVPALDGLRAVSVILVVTWHVRGGVFDELRGFVGVFIFFVLSGFLITTFGSEEEAARGRLDLRGFFIRRSARILPLFLLTLAAYVVAVLVLGIDSDRRDAFADAIPYFLLFVPEIPVFRAGLDLPFAVAWSLGIEEKFYLGWSLIGFGILRSMRPRVWVAGLLLLGALAAPAIDAGTGIYLVYYAYILVGVLLAASRATEVWTWLATRLARPAAGGAAVVVLVVLMRNGEAGGDAWPLLFGLATAALMVHLVEGWGPIVRALSSHWMVQIGKWSYGIYLVHQLVLAVLERAIPESQGDGGNLLTFLLGLPLSIAVAAVLAKYVEQPAIRWGRARAKRARRPVTVVATPEVLPDLDAPRA